MSRLPPCPRCTQARKAADRELPTNAALSRPGTYRRGFFRRRHDGRRIRRFGCRLCRRSFSTSTGSNTFGQHRPDLNRKIVAHLVSLASQRRTAKLLHINRKTVARKLVSEAALARVAHGQDTRKLVGTVKRMQFDDVETSEHTKLKPLAISLLVASDSRLIIAYVVSSMPAKGPLAKLSREKYGPRTDDRRLGWHKVLTAAAIVAAPGAELTSDSHPGYPAALRRAAPMLKHRRVKSRRATVAGQGEMKLRGFDPMFSLNHTAAMLRANVNRLIRRTWCTTKRPDRLSDHLALYARYHNTVVVPKMTAQTV